MFFLFVSFGFGFFRLLKMVIRKPNRNFRLLKVRKPNRRFLFWFGFVGYFDYGSVISVSAHPYHKVRS
ncbi:hypothetical protein Hanom_Chr16g01519941 [Helianthus anomalus]